MHEYLVISLADLMEELGESEIKNMLSSFHSPLNEDVENFIKNSAIQFTKQNLAPTKLVFVDQNGELMLCGYFTITLKMVSIGKENVSSKIFSRLKKFGTYDNIAERCNIPLPLIAQLSKNFSNDCNKLISGTELLELACREVKKAQAIVGGKAVYLECEDKEQLTGFYTKNNFVEFDRRPVDTGESEALGSDYLIQLLKYA